MNNVVLSALLMLFVINGFSQKRTVNKYPTAMLVQINTEQSRIHAQREANKNKEAEEVAEDAKHAASAMISDFSDNFSYCPVYYFIDTNREKIRSKEFAGMLMDGDGNIVNIVPQKYAVAWYGYPLTLAGHKKVVTDRQANTYDPQSRSVKGLVLADEKFQQLNYLYKLGYDEWFLKDKKHSFISKHFDIEYLPFAKTLDHKLRLNKKRNAISVRHGRRIQD